jgi:SAM-dependent methyltransferase
MIRKYHNDVKRDLLVSCTRLGNKVLDVGCGFGGDLKKWNYIGVKPDLCDPSFDAVTEVQRRMYSLGLKYCVQHGDIINCYNGEQYDIVCYNFSLHYIFESKDLFTQSIRSIRKKMKPGAKLIGVIPDSDAILLGTPYKDTDGNFMTRSLDKTGHGNFGEKLYVYLKDTPFYEDGPRAEPIAYKDLLVTHLAEVGILLQEWTPISQFYSKFIFVLL